MYLEIFNLFKLENLWMNQALVKKINQNQCRRATTTDEQTHQKLSQGEERTMLHGTVDEEPSPSRRFDSKQLRWWVDSDRVSVSPTAVWFWRLHREAGLPHLVRIKYCPGCSCSHAPSSGMPTRRGWQGFSDPASTSLIWASTPAAASPDQKPA